MKIDTFAVSGGSMRRESSSHKDAAGFRMPVIPEVGRFRQEKKLAVSSKSAWSIQLILGQRELLIRSRSKT